MNKPNIIPKIDIVNDLSTHTPAIPAIGVYTNVPVQTIIEIAVDHQLWHMVQSAQNFYEDEIMTSELMISDLKMFVQYPLSSILAPQMVSAKKESELLAVSQSFTMASEKGKVLQAIETQLWAWKKRGSFVQEAIMVADELFTNAIYNAPHVSFAENGPGVARTHENGNTLSLMPARLFLGADSSRIIIGSEDSYGTLNPCHLLKRLKACYTEGTNVAMNWSVGGAGLGTYMIFRSALAYYAGIEQGKRTVVACSFAQGARRSENVRNIHFSIDRDT